MPQFRKVISGTGHSLARGLLWLLAASIIVSSAIGLVFAPFNWVSSLHHDAVSAEVVLESSGWQVPVLLSNPSQRPDALRPGAEFTQLPAGVSLFLEKAGTTAVRLHRAGYDLQLFGGGLAGLALAALLLDIGGGQPFSRRNTRLITAIAALVFVTWAGSQFLDQATANALIADAGLGGSDLVTAPEVNWYAPAEVSIPLLALAHAFRVGARQRHDVEGLV